MLFLSFCDLGWKFEVALFILSDYNLLGVFKSLFIKNDNRAVFI